MRCKRSQTIRVRFKNTLEAIHDSLNDDAAALKGDTWEHADVIDQAQPPAPAGPRLASLVVAPTVVLAGQPLVTTVTIPGPVMGPTRVSVRFGGPLAGVAGFPQVRSAFPPC